MKDVKRRHLAEEDISYCHKVIDDLVALYRETDPQHGNTSEENKLEKAHQALNAIGSLSSILTEWAECQIFGGYYKVSKSPQMHIDEKEANSHENEIMWYGEPPDDCQATDNDLRCERLAIAKILKNTFGRYGRMEWRLTLQNSLLRLNEGETADLLTPLNTRQHGNAYDIQTLQWAAIKHLHRLLGEGIKKTSVMTDIAQKCDVDFDTIKKWERRLIKERDKGKTILTAIRQGSTFIAATKATDPALTDQDIMLKALQWHMAASKDPTEKELASLSFGIISCLELEKEFPLHSLEKRLKYAGLRESKPKKGTK